MTEGRLRRSLMDWLEQPPNCDCAEFCRGYAAAKDRVQAILDEEPRDEMINRLEAAGIISAAQARKLRG